MAKINLNGILEKVGKALPVNDNGFMKQELVLFVPGYVDQFGDKKGKDEHWCISILGDGIDRFNLHERHQGERVKTECYVNSRQYVNQSNEVFFNINVNLAKIDFVTPQTVKPETPAPAKADDDLPF